MKLPENIERFVKNRKSQITASADIDKRILDNSFAAMEEAMRAKSTINQPNIWRMIIKTKITKLAVAAVIIIAVLFGINQFSGSIDLATPAFANVAQSFNTVHTVTWKQTIKCQDAPLRNFEGMFMQPDRWRSTIPDGIVISHFQQGKTILLFTQEKRAIVVERIEKKNTFARPGVIDFFVELRNRLISAEKADNESVEFLGEQIIDGHTAIGYYIRRDVKKNTPSDITVWADAKTLLPLRIESLTTMMTGEVVTSIMDNFNFDVELDESLFSLNPPEGYVKELSSEERIRMTVPESAIGVKQAYDQAKENFHDYRMMIFDSKGNIENRIAKSGEEWRVDTYKQGIKDTGIFDTSGPPYFSGLWNQIEALQGCIDRTVMNYNSGSARGFWPQEGVGGLPRTLYQRRVGFFDITGTLEYIAWPVLPLTGRNSDIELLPPSQKYPGCIGIRYSQRTESNKRHGFPQMSVLAIYWIDPSKDYICIRREQHYRPTCLWKEDGNWFKNEVTVQERDKNNGLIYYSSEIAEITQLSQTSEGCWYPKEFQVQRYYLNNDGARRVSSPEPEIKKIFIDTQVMAKPEFFQWPKQLPLPEVNLE